MEEKILQYLESVGGSASPRDISNHLRVQAAAQAALTNTLIEMKKAGKLIRAESVEQGVRVARYYLPTAAPAPENPGQNPR